MAEYLDYLSFFGVIAYLIIHNVTENKWFAFSAILLFLPILKIINDTNRTHGVIMLILSLLIGFSTLYTKLDDDDKEENKDGQLMAVILFSIVGLVAYYINAYEGEPCGSSNAELLCNKTFIMIYILLSLSVYYLIKFLNNKGWWPFKSKSKSQSELFNIVILSVWQLYIYLLLDGFNTSSYKVSSQPSMSLEGFRGGGIQTMYKLFSYMSLIVLLGLFISNGLLSSDIESDKLNGIKELQYNLITTTILTIIIVPFIRGDYLLPIFPIMNIILILIIFKYLKYS